MMDEEFIEKVRKIKDSHPDSKQKRFADGMAETIFEGSKLFIAMCQGLIEAMIEKGGKETGLKASAMFLAGPLSVMMLDQFDTIDEAISFNNMLHKKVNDSLVRSDKIINTFDKVMKEEEK